jgi:hypothetical protein
MKTIKRDELDEKKTVWLIHQPGWACPRCKKESWATGKDEVIKKGWCSFCAFSGNEPLKIV